MNRFVPILVVGGYVGVSYSFIARKNYGTSCEASVSDPFESSLSKIRNSLNEYKHVPWNQKKNEVLIRNHALFDTLSADDRVELYEIYQHKSKQELVALLKFGNTLNGYPGILHGGISALVIDNTYGVLFMNLGLPPAFTANLNLNYRSPIKQGSLCILRAKVDSIDGRKLRMSATIEDAVTGQIQVESNTLFVNMKMTTFEYYAWLLWSYVEKLRG